MSRTKRSLNLLRGQLLPDISGGRLRLAAALQPSTSMMSLRKALGTVLAATALVLLSLAPASAEQHPKLDRAVQQAIANGAATQKVIVTVRPGSRDAVGQQLLNNGGRVKSTFTAADSIAVEVSSKSILTLANSPDVQFISADATVYAGAAAQASPKATAKKGIVAATVIPSWSGPAPTSILRQTLGLSPAPAAGDVTGVGVGVAVIDSGIQPTADLGSRIAAFYDFTRGGVAAAPYDDYGHGTHVAGLIGSSMTLPDGGVVGVAPSVHFVGLKVLDANGAGSTSDVISALDFVTHNQKRLGVQVVNLSLGHEVYAPAVLDPLVAAVQRATQSGLYVVVSAGNNGIQTDAAGNPVGPSGAAAVDSPAYSASVTSPGNAPSAITVGASTFGARLSGYNWTTAETAARGDDFVASYSGRGPTWFDGFAKPDVVAPGHFVVSEGVGGLCGDPNTRCENGLLWLQGASMAAGVTSGVVALAIDAHNRANFRQDLTPNTVKALLEFSATTLTAGQTPLDNDELAQGTGEVNGFGAATLGGAINTDAKPGSPWLYTSDASWSQHLIWGDAVLTGSVLDRNTRLFSANIVWGTNVVWGSSRDRIALGGRAKGPHARSSWGGDNIVWGTSARQLKGSAARLYKHGRAKGSWGGDNIVWGTLFDDNIVWGTSDLWGALLPPNRILGQRFGDNIVWGTWGDGDNIVWGTWGDGDNIVWGTFFNDNIVWGTSTADGTILSIENIKGAVSMAHLIGSTWGDDNVVWGTWGDDNIIWGTWGEGDNIVWGSWGDDNIIWGTWGDDNVVWGTWGEDNIIWGTWGDNIIWGTWGDNIIWGTWGDDNIIWGTWGDDNIIWGTWDGDNIIWGTGGNTNVVLSTLAKVTGKVTASSKKGGR